MSLATIASISNAVFDPVKNVLKKCTETLDTSAKAMLTVKPEHPEQKCLLQLLDVEPGEPVDIDAIVKAVESPEAKQTSQSLEAVRDVSTIPPRYC